MTMSDRLDVLVVGGGPTGLACAIDALRAGLKTLVVEKGCLVNSLFHYPPGMTFFTTRERLEIGDIPFSSINLKPTRTEALEYYRRVAEHYAIPVCYQERVTAVKGADGDFIIETEMAGRRNCHLARKVILATGYYDIPNLLGIPGEELPKVSHYYGEAHAFFGRRVVVIGGSNSAAIAALDLFRHGAEVTLVHRESELSRHIKYWIRPDIENRIKEGSIRAFFRSAVARIGEHWVKIENESGETDQVENDFVYALIGYHPDFDFIESVGVKVDAKTSRPVSNPKTLESNVPGVYLAGVIISGRHTNEIFIENGRFHGKQIISDLTKKLKADN
jgi:bacillithiol disulfide reductase